MSVDVVRIDHGDGSTSVVTWKEAELRISQAYIDPTPLMNRLALGHPIRTQFATYQHSGFYEPSPRSA